MDSLFVVRGWDRFGLLLEMMVRGMRGDGGEYEEEKRCDVIRGRGGVGGCWWIQEDVYELHRSRLKLGEVHH